jgi:signal transduction histidine kinase
MLTTFDVFYGEFRKKDALCIKSVKGLDEAYHTMLVLAAEKRGMYFIFDTNNKACAATVDTTERESHQTAQKPVKARAEISTVVPDRSLSAAVLKAQDKKHRRIRRELHDRVVQSLVAIKMEIEKLKPKLCSDDSRALDDIGRMVDEATAEVQTSHTCYRH